MVAGTVGMDRTRAIAVRGAPNDDGGVVRSSKRPGRGWSERASVTVTQLAILILALLAWEFLPRNEYLRQLGHVFDPLFISSPSSIADRLYNVLVSDAAARSYTWEYIGHTVAAAVVGLVIGLVAGGAGGLVVGNWRFLGLVLRPLAVVVNTIPRIALIPIVLVLLGTTFVSSVVNSILIVLFIAFFNSYEGATTVPPQLIQNARVLGASDASIMLHIRSPYVLAWTLASLPVAATYSILAVVTGEILSGYAGIGRLISNAQATFDSSLTFATVAILAVVGLLMVGVSEAIKRRVLHWWGR